MVDCGSPRCAQERRSFRRDLQSWSKKLTVVLGLERIAADYVPEESSQQILNPYPKWEEQMTQDFVPRKRCFHCDKKLPNVYKRIKRIIQEAKKGKEGSGKICLRSLQDLMPFCLDFYTHEFGRELFSDVVKDYFLAAPQQAEAREEFIPRPGPLPPLHSDFDPNIKIPHLCGQNKSLHHHSRIEEARPEPRGKREEYVSSETQTKQVNLPLQAGMLDASSSSCYRNKVIKAEPEEIVIEDDEEEEKYVLPPLRKREKNFYDLPPTNHNILNSDFLERASMFGLGPSSMVPPGPLGFMPYPLSISLDLDRSDLLLEQKLAQIRRMHNLNCSNRIQPPPAHANHLRLPLLMDVVRKLVHQRFMEIKQNYGRKSPPATSSYQGREESPLYNPFLSYLSAFSPYMSNDENLSSPLYKHIMESIFANMMREESPLVKPFGKVNESSRVGDTLKDIITKSISERMRFRDGSSDENSIPSSPDGLKIAYPKLDHSEASYRSNLESSNNGSPTSGGCSPPKRAKKDGGKSSKSSVVLDANGQPVKKTRPKRGQYRKYNSQLLMDAVKAVQRGEMSVHRAGSFFGVPHSTLEYKVKERHLLRQKKTRDSQSPSCKSDSGAKNSPPLSDDSMPRPSADSPKASSKKESSFRSARSSTSSVSPPPIVPTIVQSNKSPTSSSTKKQLESHSSHSPFSPSTSALSLQQREDLASEPWYPPYLSSISTDHPESSQAFKPASLSLNNSASELLRKLQHKVQTKESTFSKENAFDLSLGKDHIFNPAQASTSLNLISERRALYNQPV